MQIQSTKTGNQALGIFYNIENLSGLLGIPNNIILYFIYYNAMVYVTNKLS